MLLTARISAAAASSLALYLISDASSRAISWRYYAKKKIFSSLLTIADSFLNRSRNR